MDSFEVLVTKTKSPRGYLLDVRNPYGFWRFAGNSASSQWVVLPILFFLSLNVFSTALISDPRQQILVIYAACVAIFIAWIFFSVSFLVGNVLISAFGIPRILFVLLVYGLTEYIRISVIHTLTNYMILVGANSQLFNFVGAFVTGIVLFSLASTAKTDTKLYKSDYSELIQKKLELTSMVKSTEMSVEQTRSQLVTTTKRILNKTFESTFSQSRGKNIDYSMVAENLFRMSDEIIRPLSNKLSELPEIPETHQQSLKPQKISLKAVFSNGNKISSFNPQEFSLILGLITFPGLLLLSFPLGLFLWGAGISLVFIAHFTAMKYVSPRLELWPQSLKALVVSLVYAVPAGILLILMTLEIPDANGNEFFVFAYGALLGLLLGWLLAISDGFRLSRHEVLQNLSDLNQVLRRLGARLHAQLWLDQRLLAITIHNDVQATVISGALKLKNALGKGKDVTELFPQVKNQIRDALQLELSHRAVRSLDEEIKKLNQTWDSLLVTSLDAEKKVLEAISEDHIALEVIAEIISEFVTNSLKHGQSSRVRVTCELLGTNDVLLTLTNNGKKMSSDTKESGLGSRFMEAVTLMCSSENTAKGVQLIAQIPLFKPSEDFGVAHISS